jgi:hypothetical protein
MFPADEFLPAVPSLGDRHPGPLLRGLPNARNAPARFSAVLRVSGWSSPRMRRRRVRVSLVEGAGLLVVAEYRPVVLDEGPREPDQGTAPLSAGTGGPLIGEAWPWGRSVQRRSLQHRSLQRRSVQRHLVADAHGLGPASTRLRACWVSHAAVGWAVTSRMCTWRVACSMTKNA